MNREYNLVGHKDGQDKHIAAIGAPTQEEAIAFAREVLLARRIYDSISLVDRAGIAKTERITVTAADLRRADSVQRIAKMLGDNGFTVSSKVLGGDGRPRITLDEISGGSAEVEIDADHWKPEHDGILVKTLRTKLARMVKRTLH